VKIGWIGFHFEGIMALETLLTEGVPLEGVITLEPAAAAKRSGAADYTALCERYHVPCFQVKNINDDSSVQLLKRLSLDIAFVIGWSQIVRPAALASCRIGMIGAHASMLPRNRGSAPINWALINGEKTTGNSLIWLADAVDEGDLIDQMEIPITPYDTCVSLYEKVAETNREMLLRTIPQLRAGQRPGRPQTPTDEPLLPRRRPQDGLVDWSRSAADLYDFVRALTAPYPGAFGFLDGQRWTIWNAALLPFAPAGKAVPGEILGPMISPVDHACGQVVACGEGALVALHMENDEGNVLQGRALSEQTWRRKIWTNGP
jgi:methionyl-tRNA formyltransferase